MHFLKLSRVVCKGFGFRVAVVVTLLRAQLVKQSKGTEAAPYKPEA